MLRGEEDSLVSQSWGYFFAGVTGPDAQCLDAAFDFGNGRMHEKIWSTTQLWNSVWGNTFVCLQPSKGSNVTELCFMY